MESTEAIANRIELIVLTFQVGRKIGEEILEPTEMIQQLNLMDEEFRSMAFEGASMAVAVKSIEQQDNLRSWLTFLDANPTHSTQIMIGLGWAIGEKDLSPDSILEGLDSMTQGRAMDGFGYYMGLFRRRISIRTQQIPKGISDDLQLAFDQGIGRSLWYISKGDLEMLERMMDSFPVYRQKHMWRGIGVACPVVGGCNAKHLGDLRQLSGEFKNQLETGCAMAAKSSVVSGVDNRVLDDASELWLNRSKKEAARLTDIDSESYSGWVETISGAINS
ncbi:MAG: hypothetical protein ACI9FU_001407 [Granulosicoccus sp.]|jgi:hypothetical protein